MKIIVLVKEVPDTYGERKLDLETGLADRAASEAVLDEISERALEVALAHADAHDDVEVVAMSMAPESAATTIRKGLAMGAASAVHIADPGLAALCREVFGDTVLAYTKPALRLTGHLRGYDPAQAPTFRWPDRLKEAKRKIGEAARRRAGSAPK